MIAIQPGEMAAHSAVFELLVSPSCLQDLGLQPEDHFVLKVVQLEEITHVRHSVFVIGNTGTGVTSADH